LAIDLNWKKRGLKSRLLRALKMKCFARCFALRKLLGLSLMLTRPSKTSLLPLRSFWEVLTMAELLQEYAVTMTGPDDTIYHVRTCGEERADGTWIGWVEFHPTDLRKSTLRTGQETSQPNRTAVEYWATGLEPIYFEGAFARAE
jgi:hypothetical protein